MKATWRKLGSLPTLQKSSHSLSIVENNAYIFGGELKPREPIDGDIHILGLSQGEQDQKSMNSLTFVFR
jgi:hypothetical protein